MSVLNYRPSIIDYLFLVKTSPTCTVDIGWTTALSVYHLKVFRIRGALGFEIDLHCLGAGGLFDPTPIAPQEGGPGETGLLFFLGVNR